MLPRCPAQQCTPRGGQVPRVTEDPARPPQVITWGPCLTTRFVPLASSPSHVRKWPKALKRNRTHLRQLYRYCPTLQHFGPLVQPSTLEDSEASSWLSDEGTAVPRKEKVTCSYTVKTGKRQARTWDVFSPHIQEPL